MNSENVIPGVGKDARTVESVDGTKQAALPYAFHYLDPKALFAMARVMSEGAVKYGPPEDNWRKISVEDHLNHMMAHAYAWLAGDRTDDHLGHMACRAMGALQASLTEKPEVTEERIEEVDRYAQVNFDDVKLDVSNSDTYQAFVGMVQRARYNPYAEQDPEALLRADQAATRASFDAMQEKARKAAQKEAAEKIKARLVDPEDPETLSSLFKRMSSEVKENYTPSEFRARMKAEAPYLFNHDPIPLTKEHLDAVMETPVFPKTTAGPLCPLCKDQLKISSCIPEVYFCQRGHGQMVFPNADFPKSYWVGGPDAVQ